jgi:membrane-associated phospholipid phosphatase
VASNTDTAAEVPRRTAARPPGPVAVLLSAVVVAWLSADVLTGGWWVGVDEATSDLVRRTGIRQSFWPKVGVYTFTQLGARGTILALFVPFVVVVAWRRRTWQPLLRFVSALALLTMTVYAFKYGVGRAAPPLHRVHAEGQSYPSGHAPNSVLMWGLAAWLAAEYDLPARLRRCLDAARYTAPGLTCLAMLLLDYHWLTDLVAGLAIGVLLLRVLHLVFDGRLGRWGGGQGTGSSGDSTDRGRGLAAPGAAGARGG